MPTRSDHSGSGFGSFDAARACDAEYVVRSGPGEGISAVVARAVRAAGATPTTLVAVSRDEDGDYSIEAIHAPRGDKLVLDALTVRLKLPIASLESGFGIARAALEWFGGNGYVAFGASRGALRAGYEATVCFPDVFPWLAQNTLIAPRLVALDDVSRFSRMLSEIGIAHRVHGRSIDLAPFQLRRRPRREPVMRAFEDAVRSGLRASVYAAALPVTRCVRVEQFFSAGGGELDIAITRGLSRASCSREDLAEVDAFLSERTALGSSGLAWRVRAAGVPQPSAAPPKQARKPALRLIEGGRAAR